MLCNSQDDLIYRRNYGDTISLSSRHKRALLQREREREARGSQPPKGKRRYCTQITYFLLSKAGEKKHGRLVNRHTHTSDGSAFSL